MGLISIQLNLTKKVLWITIPMFALRVKVPAITWSCNYYSTILPVSSNTVQLVSGWVHWKKKQFAHTISANLPSGRSPIISCWDQLSSLSQQNKVHSLIPFRLYGQIFPPNSYDVALGCAINEGSECWCFWRVTVWNWSWREMCKEFFFLRFIN